MKEFSSLNGYGVKDVTARNQVIKEAEKRNDEISKLNNDIDNITNQFTTRISMRNYGFVDNGDNSDLMTQLIEELKTNKETEVIVDVYNCELGIVDLTNVFNVTFRGIGSHFTRTGTTQVNLIVDTIILNTSYEVNFYGVSIKGNSEFNVIDYTGITRTSVIENCYIGDGNVGINIGNTEDQTDVANIIIKDSMIHKNNIGLSLNSGNGRVQCISNFMYNKTYNVDVYGGVNTFTGCTHDSTEETFIADFIIRGGGLTINGHDCDCHKGYFLKGNASLPVVLNNVRHYDSQMTQENTPYSIDLKGATSCTILGGYFYNSIKIELGSNYKATVIGAYLLNGKIEGTGRILNINGQNGFASIRNSEPNYQYYSTTIENNAGLLAELKKGIHYSSVNKSQNGINILNNAYLTDSGSLNVVNSNLPVSKLEIERAFRFYQYLNGAFNMVGGFELSDDTNKVPLLKMQNQKIFFTSNTSIIVGMSAGDLCFTGSTSAPFIKVYNGSSWTTVV